MLDMIKSGASLSCSNITLLLLTTSTVNFSRQAISTSLARVFSKLVSVSLVVCGRLQSSHSLEPRYQGSLDG